MESGLIFDFLFRWEVMSISARRHNSAVQGRGEVEKIYRVVFGHMKATLIS